MGKIFIGIRDVDEKTFQQFKEISAAERAKLGQMITFAMRKIIEEKKRKKQNHWRAVATLANSKPLDFGPGSERLSEQIDEILYGENK